MERKIPNPRINPKIETTESMGVFICVLIIVLMAFFDYANMSNLFATLGADTKHSLLSFFRMGGNNSPVIINEKNTYAIMMVLLLEGAPFFLGKAQTSLMNKERADIKRKYDWFELWFSLSAFLVAYAMTVWFRVQSIKISGGFAVLSDVSKQEYIRQQIIMQSGLILSPFATSILAYVASLFISRNSETRQLGKKLNRTYKQMLEFDVHSRNLLAEYDDARQSLWLSVTADKKGDMPMSSVLFRKECYTRIHSKIVQNVVHQYPDEFNRYNKKIEEFLEQCLCKMKEKSDIEDRSEIESITLKDFITDYDNKAISTHKYGQGGATESDKGGTEAWRYEACGEYKKDNLLNLLDDAVVVAQYRASAITK